MWKNITSNHTLLKNNLLEASLDYIIEDEINLNNKRFCFWLNLDKSIKISIHISGPNTVK